MSDDEVAQPNRGNEEEETAEQSSDSEAGSQASSARSSGSASSSDAGSDSDLADLSEEEQEAIAGQCYRDGRTLPELLILWLYCTL